MTFPTRPIAKLTGHDGLVHAVTYSLGTSEYILTGGADRTIRLYSPRNAPIPTESNPSSIRNDTKANAAARPPGLIGKFSAHGYEVLSIAVNHGNDRFVSTGKDKTVFFWDVNTAQTIKRWAGHTGRINACAFAGADDSVVVTGSFDSTVKLWDTKSNASKPLMTLDEAKDAISDVAIHNAEILSGSVDGKVRSYDMRMGKCIVDVIGNTITSLTVSKSGGEMLVSSLDSTLRLMDRHNGELLKAFRDPGYANTEYRCQSTFGLNGEVVVAGSEGGVVFVWDVLEGVVRHRFRHSEMREVRTKGYKDINTDHSKSKQDVVSAVAFCPVRKEWTSAGGDGNVIVWGMGT